MNKKEKILIVGAGLCGSLLALRMAQRGYQVLVYESRSDLRESDISAGRSINLSLSARGLKALRMAGVEEKARELCIPMKGRLMHDDKSNTFESNYSGRPGECINSISRGNLNSLLLTEAEKHPNVTIVFNTKCLHIDIEAKTATFESQNSKQEFKEEASVIFGTDGAGSSLRKSYEKQFSEFSVSQDFLTHGYKELEIPADKNGNHIISKEHLHIWPRGDYMLIALPNMDGSFTVTLFLSYSNGVYNFDNLICVMVIGITANMVIPCVILRNMPSASEKHVEDFELDRTLEPDDPEDTQATSETQDHKLATWGSRHPWKALRQLDSDRMLSQHEDHMQATSEILV